MPRIVDHDRELIGYTDVWSAEAGERVELMVSTTEPVVEAQLVRLRHGDPNPAGPGFRATPVPTAVDGVYPGRLQRIACGSSAVIDDPSPAGTRGVWVWATQPAAGRRQAILENGGILLYLDADGHAAARGGENVVRSGAPLPRESWVMLAAAADGRRLTLAVGQAATTIDAAASYVPGKVHLAATESGHDHFEGRLEDPFAFEAVLSTDDLARAAAEQTSPDRVWDIREAELRNGPMTAVTGRRWDDDTTDFRAAPEQYAAVHFHSDDLDDARWEPTLSWTVPDDVASGVYAFELRAGDLTDHVPVIVRRAAASSPSPIGVLLPTLTYQVYGNERLVAGGATGMTPVPTGKVALDSADLWLQRHPEAGGSCYDYHRDGHGIALVSQRRPIPNVRPSFVWWLTNAPERFGADLYLIDWLDHLGASYDVFTDHDLHARGRPLLDRHPVVLTGTHPEYWTAAMLDALRDYLEGGGRLMYLGGNGFYWVTSIDPENPHLAEVRRGINGTRAWSSRPGELRHQTTGEQGGLWRYRGRSPNELVGVGFAAQADTTDRAPGYRRTDTSRDARYAWIFDGVESDIIGCHGLYLGGAAGYEIDRHDPAFGSSSDAVVLATSKGMHPDSYLLVVEDMEVTSPDVTGSRSDRVRADLTYVPYPNGGAVFSVGSCSWCGSLSTNDYENDIARITENVLRRFQDGPSATP